MLEVLVLGTAAGGGFPQWNCACPNCRLARAGSLPARLQSALAVSGDGRTWHLVNASPDIATQIGRGIVPRQPVPAGPRFSPVRSVFVTNADLDHTLGLLLLREGERLEITAPPAVRASLERAFGAVLAAYAGVSWRDASEGWTVVDESGLEVRAVPLPAAGPPRYDPAAGGVQAVGYLFRGGNAVAGVFPDVPALDDALLAVLAECDRVWFDGTFWDEDELRSLNGRTAAQMGHVPVDRSLPLLATLGRGRIDYLHLNNTNPLLRPDSAERAAVEAAGLRVAEDDEHVLL